VSVAKPQLVAQIEFTEWMPDGDLRYASFAVLRNEFTGCCRFRRWRRIYTYRNNVVVKI
jgi:hypothetical protein